MGIKKTFEWFGFNVEKSQKGFPIDLFIKDGDQLIFSIEATGTNKKIKNESKKIAQIFDYIQNREGEEKILLIANTYKDKEPKKRDKENFTEKVINILEKNNVCLLTSFELYSLWAEYITDKMTKDKIVDSLLNSNGILEIS